MMPNWIKRVLFIPAAALAFGLTAPVDASADGQRWGKRVIYDRVEDRLDRIENRIDRRRNLGPRDRIEDRLDRIEDRIDRRTGPGARVNYRQDRFITYRNLRRAERRAQRRAVKRAFKRKFRPLYRGYRYRY